MSAARATTRVIASASRPRALRSSAASRAVRGSQATITTSTARPAAIAITRTHAPARLSPPNNIITFFQPKACSRAYGTTSSPTPKKQCSNPECSTKPSLPLEALTCDACGSLQPIPSEIDFYTLLSLESDGAAPTLQDRWNVDLGALKAAWRKKMALTHPDRMGQRSEREKGIAEQQSALINKAYETLNKPLARAVYLLEIHASESVSEADSLDDPQLLMQVMELREQLEEASEERQVEAVREENSGYLDDALARISAWFEQNGKEGAAQQDWAALKKLTVELRYWNNIEDVCREWQPGKEIVLHH